MGFNPKQVRRESLSRDDAKLLREIVEHVWYNTGFNVDKDRVNFLLAKLKRLEK